MTTAAPFDAHLTTLQGLANACTVVRAFAASDCARAAVAMLDALIEGYKLDLMQVRPEKLDRLQAAIQQAAAIRAVLADETLDPPKI
ncbi:hypothetical protein [Polaromonas sp. CG9_12]|nr:hypothetical protein [Polaromonas sp. CG9_12]